MANMRRCARFVVFALAFCSIGCLWDYDTLKQERARFPNTMELITGKFLRHSKEFYEWRINDRLPKLKVTPNESKYYDDLAVAYEKTGQHGKAIDTILEKEKLLPGLYETYSNLGTFYILAGEFEKGLPYLDKTLAINPNAHFGREKYQKWLVEYAISKRKDGKISFPLHTFNNEEEVIVHQDEVENGCFSDYVAARLNKKTLTIDDCKEAVTGVLGMMRFADHENPLLLEALGDLLVFNGMDLENDAKQLAAMAYIKASYSVQDSVAKDKYLQSVGNILNSQKMGEDDLKKDEKVAIVRKELDRQLADAAQWYQALKNREIAFIKSGSDPEAEFDKWYYEEPKSINSLKMEESIFHGRNMRIYSLILLSAVMIPVVLIAFRRMYRSGKVTVRKVR